MKLYRYSNNTRDSAKVIGTHVFDNAHVYLHEFEVIKETPCGGWIEDVFGKKRFVNLTCYKQYAYKELNRAEENYLTRKKMQIKILSYQLLDSEDSMRAMKVKMSDGLVYPEWD